MQTEVKSFYRCKVQFTKLKSRSTLALRLSPKTASKVQNKILIF